MRTRLTVGLAVGTLLAGATVVASVVSASAAADPHERDLAQARAATTRFHDVAEAEDEGRFVLADLAGFTCIEDPGGSGGMGVHYVDGDLVGDGEIDVREPEALMYDMSGPKPRLVGVEYVVFVSAWGDDDPPSLFGHEFHLVEPGNRYGLPAFYELHAWIWHHNPSGMHEDWNPRVDC